MRTDRCDRDPHSLHPELERWAREQGWDSLRPFQQESAELILGSNCDLIISASTSAGKSEAAFLPLLTRAEGRKDGVSVLCLSPTKALINDQTRRLMVPASRVRVPIYAWHGDAPQSGKRKLLRDRIGMVIMTVESFEGRMVRHPRMIEEMFSALDAVVIDEFHEFQDGARGAQLNSLLSRLDALTRKATRRIALSATIAPDSGPALGPPSRRTPRPERREIPNSWLRRAFGRQHPIDQDQSQEQCSSCAT
jgi:ATP-dependent Lhr-like helicase